MRGSCRVDKEETCGKNKEREQIGLPSSRTVKSRVGFIYTHLACRCDLLADYYTTSRGCHQFERLLSWSVVVLLSGRAVPARPVCVALENLRGAGEFVCASVRVCARASEKISTPWNHIAIDWFRRSPGELLCVSE